MEETRQHPAIGAGQDAGKIAIIGDVHGVLDAVETLVDMLDMDAGDHLIFAGDLVDKGPHSAGVVRFVRRLAESAPFKVTLVEGNHEDRHRRYHINKTKRPAIAYTMAAAAWDLPALDMQLTADDRAWLAAAVPFVKIPAWDAIVVHGGIPGNMETLPESPEAASSLTGKRKSAFRQILRTRYIDGKTGSFVAFGREQPGDVFWAETYDGRFGHVVFGHQPFMEGPACFSNATGIDTAAVHGGALTALVLPSPKSGAAEPHFVSVPSRPYRSYRASAQPSHPGGAITLTRAI
ncbi:MAG: metallophosphoesterase family protein [Pseudomonadota bacterium]